jgi:hypothetical protein
MDRNPKAHQYLEQPLKEISEVHSLYESVKKQYNQNNIGRFVIILKEVKSL